MRRITALVGIDYSKPEDFDPEHMKKAVKPLSDDTNGGYRAILADVYLTK
jgi:hypothetical protein